jgi:hypothetical protein
MGSALGDEIPALGEAGHWRLLLSPYALHYRYSPEHKRVWALGFERQRDDGWLGGASYFRNSFGQPSGYVYIGRRYEHVFGDAPVFAQWSAGVLYGYVGKYKNKVPLNFGGFSPGALASMGWQIDARSSATLHLLGDAGVMLQLAYELR